MCNKKEHQEAENQGQETPHRVLPPERGIANRHTHRSPRQSRCCDPFSGWNMSWEHTHATRLPRIRMAESDERRPDYSGTDS